MIADVSAALVAEIGRHTPDLGSWIEQSSLSAADPAPAANKLVVCLYAAEEHPQLRNRPLESTDAGYVRPPLALRLEYLIAYFGTGHDEAQRRLSRVLAVFHTTPVLGPQLLPAALAQQVERIAVRLRSTTPDERNQIWGALGRPGRLALYYTVDVAPVPPLAQQGRRRVEEHRVDYARMAP